MSCHSGPFSEKCFSNPLLDEEGKKAVLKGLSDIVVFAHIYSGLHLRSYQKEVVEAVIDSVEHNRGLSIVVVFPRQSGKNELQALIEAYLMLLLREKQVEAEMVKVAPTWKPQCLNAMRRLERTLKRINLYKGGWKKEAGYIYRLGKASIAFFSGQPEANVVGATANLLLECDEAQDVPPAKWDKDFAPMAASKNATRVYWGTMWTGDTLLSRELKRARQLEASDGQKRAFVIGGETVAQEVPSYRRHVEEQVALHGRDHPLIKTQYFSEEIDTQAGMFPERRLALLQGDHERRHAPLPGRMYALLIDVAGEDEGAGDGAASLEQVMERFEKQHLANPDRDATALTVVEVDPVTLADELIEAPVYRVVDRRSWTGIKHPRLYGEIRALAEHWRARKLVVDATGVGAGLASFLEKALPGRVVPFVFNSASKSKLGWDLLTLIETGRLKEYRTTAGKCDRAQEEFFTQLRHCQFEIYPGLERRMKWGVQDGTRDRATGESVHDDWIISLALAAALDESDWRPDTPAVVIHARDPLEEMREF